MYLHLLMHSLCVLKSVVNVKCTNSIFRPEIRCNSDCAYIICSMISLWASETMTTICCISFSGPMWIRFNAQWRLCVLLIRWWSPNFFTKFSCVHTFAMLSRSGRLKQMCIGAFMCTSFLFVSLICAARLFWFLLRLCVSLFFAYEHMPAQIVFALSFSLFLSFFLRVCACVCSVASKHNSILWCTAICCLLRPQF